jgi:hypothetical protein
MQDAELSAYCMVACSMRACASRCKLRASGIDGPGMARSSIATAMNFWLAWGSVCGPSTLKSALMRTRACLPASHARSLRVEASRAMVALKSRTCRYSSASLASSLRAWASCLVMSAPPAGRAGGRFTPRFWGASPSHAPFALSACSSMTTTKHSHAGS